MYLAKLMSGLKSYIWPLLILVGCLCFIKLNIQSLSEEEHRDLISQRIEEVLDKQLNELMQSEKLFQFSKISLNVKEYNDIQHMLTQLEEEKFQVEIYKTDELIFWTRQIPGEAFCKDIHYADYTGSICYAPFDEQGEVIASQLDRLGLGHYFSVNHSAGGMTAAGLPLKMGRTYTSPTKEKVLLGFYLLGFLWICGLSLIRKEILPLIGLLLIRLLGYNYAWSSSFSLEQISYRLFYDYAYNAIDLLSDGLLSFAFLIVMAELLFKNKTKAIPKVGLTGLASLHILVFSAHLRAVQLFVSSKEVDLNLQDLSQVDSVDFIFFSVALLTLLGVFHFGYSLFTHQRNVYLDRTQTYLTYGVSVLLALIISQVFKLDVNPLVLIFFLVLYLTLLDLFVEESNRTVTWVIWWGIFFALYVSSLLFNYDIKNEVRERQAYLEKVYHNIPTEDITEIEESGLIVQAKELLQQLIILPEGAHYDKNDISDYINDLLKRDDLIVELLDKQGHTLFDDSALSKHYFNSLVRVDSLLVFDELKNILWFDQGLINNKKTYIGYLRAIDESTTYPYNYYRDNKLIYKNQQISREEIHLLENGSKAIVYNGADILISYKPSSGRMLITKKSFQGLVKPIAVFSFVFCILIMLVLILAILKKYFKVLPESWSLIIENVESLNSKIQLSLLLVIFISFLVIATITSSFIKDYLGKDRQLAIVEKLENVAQEFENKTGISNSAPESVEILSNYRKEIEKEHNISLSLYPLQASDTELDYFTKMYFTKQINPTPFSQVDEHGQTKSYLPLRYGESLAGIAAISLNHKLNPSSLNVFDFLGSIFNVYVFLFLIASVLSIFIAESITRPLSILNKNLTEIGLEKHNEQIDWKRDDEIGQLIDNYNKMVVKLEESAEILAKKERDSAWREMAKQVAHEIKNPLTPMKLSIQYLEKAIKREPSEAIPISRKISRTMLEQIDNLTGIADAFGNFAKLPKTSNVKIELNNVVDVVHNLFRKREDMEINLSVPIDPVYVHADKHQLIRILNNLVKNAIEAIPSSRKGRVDVSLTVHNKKALIKVTDNGAGIPEDMYEKVFQPKFTTKDSGSGLGLAIAANMIESMNGRLYFESTIGISTTFFIELDILRHPIYADSAERITLE